MPSSALPAFRNMPLFVPSGRNEVMSLWGRLSHHDAVCFDVDSTVIMGEFIDELAEYLGCGDRVQQVTKNAMGGSMNFRTALRERLNIMRPSMQSIQDFIDEQPICFTPGIRALVETLHRRKVSVYLVSGGFDILIRPVARLLRIPESNIFANKLFFNNKGEYTGFDETEPTSMSGGKALAVSAIKERGAHKYVVMVGDGATDAEACPPANAFIGFGGNVTREAVRRRCHYYVHTFDELLQLLHNTSNLSTTSHCSSFLESEAKGQTVEITSPIGSPIQ